MITLLLPLLLLLAVVQHMFGVFGLRLLLINKKVIVKGLGLLRVKDLRLFRDQGFGLFGAWGCLGLFWA